MKRDKLGKEAKMVVKNEQVLAVGFTSRPLNFTERL